jgi:hypothetical protein
MLDRLTLPSVLGLNEYVLSRVSNPLLSPIRLRPENTDKTRPDISTARPGSCLEIDWLLRNWQSLQLASSAQESVMLESDTAVYNPCPIVEQI